MNPLKTTKNIATFTAFGLLLLMLFVSNIFAQEMKISPLLPNQTMTREMTGDRTHRYKFDV